MAKKDYYDLLGVSKGVDDKALKSAYRKKAMEFHPDRNPDDAEAEAKLKEVNEAYGILSDAEKRAAYDRFGHDAFEGGMGGGGRGPGGAGGAGFGDFSDIFEEMFGAFGGGGRGRGGRSAPNRGSSLEYALEISLEEAFEGVKKTISFPVKQSCGSCDGSGAKAGSTAKPCPTCQGRGRVRQQQGFFAMERGCPTCQGQGTTISDPCGSCNGQGRISKEKKLAVTIPAGVQDGTTIQYPGAGEAGLRGGSAGDLHVVLSVRNHSVFERDDNDLHVETPISFVTAALGGKVTVPTIDGRTLQATIEAGTQHGKTLRLRGQGMSVYNSSLRGDLILHASIEVPVRLNEEQKGILRQFEEKTKESDNYPKIKGFMKRLKDLF